MDNKYIKNNYMFCFLSGKGLLNNFKCFSKDLMDFLKNGNLVQRFLYCFRRSILFDDNFIRFAFFMKCIFKIWGMGNKKLRNKFKEIKSYFNKNKNGLLSRLNKNQVEELKKEYYDYTKDFNRNVKETQKILKQLYSIPDLNHDEKWFLVEWAIDSGPLNRYIRRLHNVSSSKERHFKNYLKHLNNGINKFENIKHNTMLHRRVGNDFYIADVGKVRIFETPISTSFNDYAIKNKNYGDFHITVLAPKGSNGAYFEEFMKKYNYDNHNHEEWLLPINTPYKTLYKNYETKEAVIILLS